MACPSYGHKTRVKVALVGKVWLAVNGGLMRGMPSNGVMLDAGATFVREETTAPDYRIWSIDDDFPGMMRAKVGGGSISLELWEMTPAGFVEVLQSEPPGLGVAKITLVNNETVLGVVAEPILCDGQLEITGYGGWRQYVESISKGGSK